MFSIELVSLSTSKSSPVSFRFFTPRIYKKSVCLASDSDGCRASEDMTANVHKGLKDRDAKLKVLLSEEQMKTWKEQIEPSMRPQRPAGGQGGGGK